VASKAKGVHPDQRQALSLDGDGQTELLDRLAIATATAAEDEIETIIN